MTPITWIILFVIVVLVAVGWAFNALIKMRNIVRTAWADIDVQLKRRADLVPNLVQTVKGYSGFERTVLEEVTQARANTAGQQLPPAQRAEVESKLGSRIGQLMAVVENYPELKASANYLQLQNDLRDIEGTLASARQYYNAAVRDYNTMLESFPLGMLGKACGFKKSEYFNIADPEDREAPQVKVTP